MARHWDEMKFVGNRFRVAKFELLDSGLYDNKLVEKLCARRYRHVGKDAASLSGDYNAVQAFNGRRGRVRRSRRGLPPRTDHRHHPPRPRAAARTTTKVLRTVEYEGPERGPYHMLGFAYVPDNVLPIAARVDLVLPAHDGQPHRAQDRRGKRSA
jgi:hypothetical protein